MKVRRRDVAEAWPYGLLALLLAAGTWAIGQASPPPGEVAPAPGIEAICTANLSLTERDDGWRVLETGRKMTISRDVQRRKVEVRLKRAALFCEFGDGKQHPVSLWYWRDVL